MQYVSDLQFSFVKALLYMQIPTFLSTWGFSMKQYTPSAGSVYEMKASKSCVRDSLCMIFFALEFSKVYN